jgi:hypothetical protein
VRRPRGLVAAAIQYGHINVHVTPGYAGNYASGFPDDLAFEQWLERIDQATDLEAYLDAGGHLSGPAAGELEQRVRGTSEKFAGKVLLTGRQARKLLQDPCFRSTPDAACTASSTAPKRAASWTRTTPPPERMPTRLRQNRPHRPRHRRTPRQARSHAGRLASTAGPSPAHDRNKRVHPKHHRNTS